jgi:hypothetical protein
MSQIRTILVLTSVSLLMANTPSIADNAPTATAHPAPKQTASIDTELGGALDSLSEVELKGVVSINDTHDKLAKTVNGLIEAAVQHDPDMKRLNAACAKYRTKKMTAAAWAASALNYGILTRGDMPSSEAGDVILNEKLKLKSRGSSEYIRQTKVDSIQLKVISSVMEVAMALGTKDPERSNQLLDAGQTSLAKLVGEERGSAAVQELRQCASEIQLPDTTFAQQPWGMQENEKRLNFVLQSAMDNDEMVTKIKQIVHKYNHHSKLYRVSSRVMNVSLSIIGMSPTFAGPAAQLALLAYIMATGGPEEDKLMSELYLDKRLASRFDLLKDESQLALDKYEIAVLTKNPMLLACSQSVVRRITSEELSSQVFSPDFSDAKEKTIAKGTIPSAIGQSAASPAVKDPAPVDATAGGAAGMSREETVVPANLQGRPAE